MTLNLRQSRYSISEYLAAERFSLDKHEYCNGNIAVMPGNPANHSLISANVNGTLGSALKGKLCQVYDSNLRVCIPRTVLYTYPDVSVICGPRAIDPNDPSGETVTNPKLIVEVLSPSTEAYDRGDKFAGYRQLESLEEYVLVSLSAPRIETFYRAPAPADTPADQRTWLISTSTGTDAAIRLRSLDLHLPLAEIYRGLNFPSPQPTTNN